MRNNEELKQHDGFTHSEKLPKLLDRKSVQERSKTRNLNNLHCYFILRLWTFRIKRQQIKSVNFGDFERRSQSS